MTSDDLTPDLLPKGALLDIRMTVRLPCEATEAQIEDWFNLNLGQCGTIQAGNPLSREEPESWALRPIEWDDTGRIGRIEQEKPREDEDGVTRARTRYWSEDRA